MNRVALLVLVAIGILLIFSAYQAGKSDGTKQAHATSGEAQGAPSTPSSGLSFDPHLLLTASKRAQEATQRIEHFNDPVGAVRLLEEALQLVIRAVAEAGDEG